MATAVHARCAVLQVEALAASELTRLLHAAGVAHVYERAQAYLTPGDESGAADATRMADDPELTGDAVAAALRGLFVFASSADAVPEYEHLAAPRLRHAAARRVAAGLAAAFRDLHAALGDPARGYDAAALEAVRHTPAQVATLLGVSDESA